MLFNILSNIIFSLKFMSSTDYCNPSKKVAMERVGAMIDYLVGGKGFFPPEHWLGAHDMCWGLPGDEGRVCFWSTSRTGNLNIII